MCRVGGDWLMISSDYYQFALPRPVVSRYIMPQTKAKLACETLA